ncbi:MAG: sigma 54-interacting transcriptional regulator [Deltaproteobacteria bacterium]|nr:sigma 54-interacting transcriptional regulator [Deltaproteobacteria bacterium]
MEQTPKPERATRNPEGSVDAGELEEPDGTSGIASSYSLDSPEPIASDASHVILDAINEGVFTVDLDWRITSFNRAAERISGIARDDALGQRCSEVLRASICEGACALRSTLETGKPTQGERIYIVDAEGAEIPVKISAAVLRGEGGEIVGGVETFSDLREVEALKKQLKEKHSFADIIGKSEPMQRLFALLPPIAASHATVLIEGASGTGKELVAQAIHALSSRREGRFVAVNCGALPDTLLESELFGYKAGAFTDARQDKPGRFALAEGGTLFLDEIGDISPAMQARLLRVLQEHVYEPLGAVEPVSTDARIVAASNKDLSVLVQEGIFREDLFYRIRVVHLGVPALSERREDIPLLVEHFIARFNRLEGKAIGGLAPSTLALLMAHAYPGNVRELQNIIEHAFVLCPGGDIEVAHLPSYLWEGDAEVRSSLLGGALGAPRAASLAVSGGDLRSRERTHIVEVLRKHDGNRTRAARELGINPSTLYRKMSSLEIDIPSGRGRGR